MKSTKNYLVYLDHNIFDQIIKDKLKGLKSYLSKNFTVIYSIMNLKEISKSHGYEKKFLNCLADLKAKYLELKLTDDFQITDQAMIYSVSPYDVFEDYCNQDPLHHRVKNNLENITYKMLGGLKGEGFSTIIDESTLAFNELMNDLKKNIKFEIQDSKYLEDNTDKIDDEINIIKNEFKNSVSNFLNTINNSITDQENFSLPKLFKNATKLGPEQLNNLNPPNIIEKIWELINKNNPYFSKAVSLEEFLFYPLKKESESKKKDIPLFEKINCLYHQLNVIGYYPDTKLTDYSRFQSSQCDQNHACYGGFTDMLLSSDVRFIKKASAIYEYLDINTQLFLFTNEWV